MSESGIRFYVSGRVQGVLFRKGTQFMAIKLHLRGYVKNLPDGRVECVAVGLPENLEILIGWAHTGTPFARVEQVEIEPYLPDTPFTKFSIL